MQFSSTRTVLRSFLAAGLLFLAGGCSDTLTGGDDTITLSFTFEESAEGWTGAFTDYPTDKSPEDMELAFDRRPLPEDVDGSGTALYLAGRNLSDDLFMFLKRRVDGLQPNTTYALTFELDVASNAPSGCAGIGGAPGESVYMKVGAARVEPVPVEEEGDYRLNVDKGNQAAGGENAVVAGHIANGIEQCTGEVPYRLITLENRDEPLEIATDADGRLWLFVGTDSGFEGKTALYYDAIRVTLVPQEAVDTFRISSLHSAPVTATSIRTSHSGLVARLDLRNVSAGRSNLRFSTAC